MSNVDDKTKKFLRLSSFQTEEEMDDEDKISYIDILKSTTKKYEELLGSDDWSPRVPSKKNSDEPDLPKATMAAIDKAISASVSKFTKPGGNHGVGSGKGGKSSFPPSNPDVEYCQHCDEKGHRHAQCPHKDKKWFHIPPKGKQYSCRHHFKGEMMPILYCKKCKTWRYTDRGGHLAKDHDDFLKGPFSPKKGGQKKGQFQPAASPAIDEGGAPLADGGDIEATAFSAMWGQANWL